MMKIPLAAAAAAPLALGAAFAQAPVTADDGEYVSVSGVVARAEDDSFWLDYGEGSIEVELDEGLLDDLDLEDRLTAGERVVAYGSIDDEWFSGKVLDADAVYVPKRSAWYNDGVAPVVTTYYYYFLEPDEPTSNKGLASADVSFTGKVKSIDGRKFTLDAGKSNLTVDTATLAENPLDGEGYPKIETGDRVMVSGKIDNNLFATRVLRADKVLSVDGASSMRTSRAGAPTGDEPKEGYYGPDGASASRENPAERRVESATTMSDPMTGPDVMDGSAGDGAQNPVFLAIDADENGAISEKEYVKFVQRPANISRDEARMFFEATADGDDKITPIELFSANEDLDKLSQRITDANR